MSSYRFPRKKGRYLIEYPDSDGNRCTAFTRDVSLSGFFVTCEKSPPPGRPLTVKLHAPRGKVLELAGTVVRVGRSSAAIGTSVATGFAFAIQGLNDDWMALIDALQG
ncbi:MAG TPA: PilZ domain-containing protein [Thermoanaerobaculia bacterium]|nr:PilZ domain-containing protein [Thermoanaerobaculia bacterium]